MKHTEHKTLFPFIQKIESDLQRKNLHHRFVGGVSFGGLLNEHTTWDIDIAHKTVTLKHANDLPLYRRDKTKKDIDIILLSKHPTSTLHISEEIIRVGIPVSIEEIIYFPRHIHAWKQFVTTLFVDERNDLYLIFQSVKQKITWESIEAWKVVVGNISYTVRNPVADYFAYQFRSPSGVKPKDKDKVLLIKKLADDVIRKGKGYNINYLSDAYFGTWQSFITQIHSSQDISIKLKRMFMMWYWETIGEYLGHGKGVGNLFIKLQNKFIG